MSISAVALEAPTLTTWDRLRAIIADKTGLPAERITRDKQWCNVNADMIRQCAVEIEIEEEFRIRITPKEVDRCNNFGELSDYIDMLMRDG